MPFPSTRGRHTRPIGTGSMERVEPSDRSRRLSDMWRLACVGVGLLLASSACSGDSSSEVTNVRAPAVPTAVPSKANLTLIVINEVDRKDRIRVDINGRRAVDGKFPAAAGRAHPPIFEYPYAVPRGTTTIRVKTPGDTQMLRVPTTTMPNWVVVQNQSDAVGTALELFQERPAFG